MASLSLTWCLLLHAPLHLTEGKVPPAASTCSWLHMAPLHPLPSQPGVPQAGSCLQRTVPCEGQHSGRVVCDLLSQLFMQCLPHLQSRGIRMKCCVHFAYHCPQSPAQAWLSAAPSALVKSVILLSMLIVGESLGEIRNRDAFHGFRGAVTNPRTGQPGQQEEFSVLGGRVRSSNVVGVQPLRSQAGTLPLPLNQRLTCWESSVFWLEEGSLQSEPHCHQHSSHLSLCVSSSPHRTPLYCRKGHSTSV